MMTNLWRIRMWILLFLSQISFSECQTIAAVFDSTIPTENVKDLVTETSNVHSRGSSTPTKDEHKDQTPMSSNKPVVTPSESRTDLEDDDDDDDYIPFQWVVELRERRSFLPVVSYTKTDDEEGRDMYRNRGFTQILFRKIERIEEIHHNEEEWLKERKRHRDEKFFNEKGERTDAHGRPLTYHNGEYSDSGIRNYTPVKVKPFRSPLRRYKKPPRYPPTKDFKVDNNFKDWVMKGVDFPAPPKESPVKF